MTGIHSDINRFKNVLGYVRSLNIGGYVFEKITKSLIVSDKAMNNRFSTPTAKMQIRVHSRRTGSALYLKFHYLTTLVYDMLQKRGNNRVACDIMLPAYF